MLVEETFTPGTRGRPSMMLELGPATDVFIGIEISEQGGRILGVDGSGALIGRPLTFSGGSRVEEIERLVAHFLVSCPNREVGAIVVGVPGVVSRDGQRVQTSARLPHLEEITSSDLDSAFGTGPCVFANDANCMALAEYHHGVNTGLMKEGETLLCIYASRGLGAGIVDGGRIIPGASGSAGEISHVRLSKIWDEECTCGGRGCLETIVSGGALIKQVRAAGFPVESVDDILEFSRRGHLAPGKLMEERARTFGTAVAMLANFLNPANVVLTGDTFRLEGYAEDVIRYTFEASHPITAQGLTIRTSCESMPCVAYGAALVARSRVLPLELSRPLPQRV
ncbi:MAG: ROK family protein [Flaviflexus sp.]|nr:ROK family protein [Flaviflexus sp.]